MKILTCIRKGKRIDIDLTDLAKYGTSEGAIAGWEGRRGAGKAGVGESSRTREYAGSPQGGSEAVPTGDPTAKEIQDTKEQRARGEPFTPEQKARAYQMLQEVVVEMKPVVANIEKSPLTTKDHYGDYMAFLSKVPKEQIKTFGMVLIKAGANPSGVGWAIKLLNPDTYQAKMDSSKKIPLIKAGTSEGALKGWEGRRKQGEGASSNTPSQLGNVKSGERLVWVKPADKDEQGEVLTVVEDRGDRVLVASSNFTAQGGITPTAVYAKKDLERIGGGEVKTDGVSQPVKTNKSDIISHLKNNTLADTVGTNKSGNIVARRGFFYPMGMDDTKFANGISNSLKTVGIPHEVVNHGEHYTPFRGGDSVARGSHFYVEIKPKVKE